MTFSREWAIPSADTFTVRPVHDIFLRWRQTLPQGHRNDTLVTVEVKEKTMWEVL